jgi:4-hydroxymandelate oxidase
VVDDPPAVSPADAPTIVEYRRQAQARLAGEVWNYLQSGSASGLTRRANRFAFDQRVIVPRPLADVRGGHTRLRLLDLELAHPILLAPVAFQRLFHPDGECASAMAAHAQGGAAMVSSLASQAIEAVAGAGEGAAWFQLYWQGDRRRTLRLARRALAAGCPAIVLTVDAPVKQATFSLPPEIRAVNLEVEPAPPSAAAGQSAVFDGWMARAPRWDDLAWLRDQVRVPLLLKGIMHPDDAERALAVGCDGVVVSNHGGRVLDGAPASLDALPAVVERVGGRAPVLLDSGVRSGHDVFKALAAGAAAVCIGRPYIWGLAAAGALGVARVIRLLRDELEMTMALAGCSSLSEAAGCAVTIQVRSRPR